MGKKDTYSKEFMFQNSIFADAMNYALYHGEQRIKPEELTQQDPSEISIVYGEEKICIPVNRMRDVLKLCTIMKGEHANYILFGLENQDAIHYAMAVRVMLYDALNYASQVSEIAKNNRKEKLYTDSNEFLSGLLKTDRLKPVITVVIYFGSKEWDAKRSLYEMLDADEETLKLVENYRYHLIIPKEIEDFDNFKTDLGYVMKFLKYADDEATMDEMLRNGELFNNPDVSVVNFLQEITGIKIDNTQIKKEGDVNMIKAWEDHAKNAAKEATKETTKKIVTNMLKANKSDAEIMKMTELNKEELEAMKAEIFALK